MIKNHIIETSRLLLRQWQDNDFEPFAALNSNPQVMRYFPHCLDRAASDALILRLQESIEKNGFGFYAAQRKSDDCFIGFIGANKSRSDLAFSPCVDIGWRLDQAYWGQGYATEGALAVRDDCFTRCQLDEIVSMTPVVNTPSENVMRKIGMQRQQAIFNYPDMPLNHPLVKHLLYRMSLAQWLAQTGS